MKKIRLILLYLLRILGFGPAQNQELLELGHSTLFHNRVLVLNHLRITTPTASHKEKYRLTEPELPLMFQDHKNEVSFRNIWIRIINH